MADKEFDGKSVLITGGGGGFGAAFSRALADRGAAVTLTDINESAGSAAAESITDAGGRCNFMVQDVTDDASWEQAVELALGEFGGLDIVINNAGIEISQLLVDTDPAECLALLNINVVGTMLGMKHAFRVMQPGGAAGKGGVVLNLASVAAISATPGLAVYSASKAAVANLTWVGASEAGRQGYGVRVNSLCPSLIDTAMGRKLIADFTEMGFGESAGEIEDALLERMPVGRYGTVQDVVEAALYLCSERSAFLTGVSLPVDGGMSIPE
jgi:NAD(P)-dependent dehydrogenase (short-subunit alcohol dehydrogenase family)